jgi:ribonuclease HII
MENAVAVGIGIVDAETIDKINIKQAARLAMKIAVEQLAVAPEHLLVDAEVIALPIEQTSIIKGDASSASIAAASVIAKVTRDRMCVQWEAEYPGYGLAVHKGYATKQHREAIKALGPTKLHRQSFLGNILAEQSFLF